MASDSDPGFMHGANDHYVNRLPTPPRPTFISPCVVNDGQPPVQVNLTRSLPFLRHYDWSNFLSSQQQVNSWKYESRREAQNVLPFLYLGPSTVCKDEAYLTQARISMVLFVRHASPLQPKPLPPSIKKAQDLGITIQTLDVTSSQELIAAFTHATRMINTHLTGAYANSISPNVLICCDSGNARSAAVTVAYCMDILGITLETALQFVHSKRFCTSLDDSLKFVLASYADILRARRDVENVSAPSVGIGPQYNNGHRAPTTKRSRQVDDDDDMGEAGDLPRFEDRSFTPFISG